MSIGLFIIGVYTHPHGARGACCEEPEAIRQRGCTTRSGSSPVRSRDRAAARHGFGWHRVLSPAKKIFDGCEARNGYSTRDGSPDLAHDCGFGSSEIDHDRWPESTTASTAWSSPLLDCPGSGNDVDGAHPAVMSGMRTMAGQPMTRGAVRRGADDDQQPGGVWAQIVLIGFK